MIHFVLHVIISAVIRGFIYLAIWKAGRNMPLSHLLIFLAVPLLIFLSCALVWWLFTRWKYRA